MGFAAAGQCFSDAVQAATVACSSAAGVSAGGVMSCNGVTLTGDRTVAMQMVIDSASGTTAATHTVDLLPCEPLTVADGIELGWQVGAVFLVAAGIKWIARAMQT